ncbi:MAG: hypothetical protein JWN09_972 [Microbacteriaceae bacterium]|jgi:very-short-patch-repair endonuclease|nr:hypothetical protein [Microbacteriaceae bacterium]
MPSILRELDRLGGIARVSTLVDHGIGRGQIRTAVQSGIVGTIRRGWVRSADAAPLVIEAVQLGGRLGCISAAEHLGLWTLRSGAELHLGIPSHSGRAQARTVPGVVAHWQADPWRLRSDPIESVANSLAQMAACQPSELVVAAIDSALNKGLVSVAELRSAITPLPRDRRNLLEWSDGQSQSGLESLCRYRLSLLGLRIRSQVHVEGVGWVDLLIGDRLVLEADGRQWHESADAYATDRARDLRLTLLGYHVIRLTFEQIVNGWPLVELTIAGLVERGEHLWSRMHRRSRLA